MPQGRSAGMLWAPRPGPAGGVLSRREGSRVAHRTANLHVQRLLCLHYLFLRAVADQSVSVREVQVECYQGAMLHAQGAQSRAVNLGDSASVS